MGPLRVYNDSALADLVTRGGNFANPDTSALSGGSYPQTSVKAVYVAPEQGLLSGAIDDSQIRIELAAARFALTNWSQIIVNSEVMLITAGHGTTTLTVTRAYAGTSAAAHVDGAAVVAHYNFWNIKIFSPDSSLEHALDVAGSPGSYAATLSLSDIAYNGYQKIWRKVTATSGGDFNSSPLHRLSYTFDKAA